MMLAAVHLAPVWSIAPAVALSAALVWYWHRLGQAEVPPSRRRIRRWSLALMLVSLPLFVRALSFVDPKVDHRAYVMTWTLATFLVLIVIVVAIIDALNNVRLLAHQHDEALQAAATGLAAALRERKRSLDQRIAPGSDDAAPGKAGFHA